MKRLLLAIPFLSPLTLCAQVDLIAIHGKIWTENPQQPEAEAIAVAGHRILAVGTTEDIERFKGPATRILDLEGRRVVPGFNDAHVHFFWGGQGLASVQLRDVTSREQFTQRMADYARTRPTGEWIVDGNWDEQKWMPVALPTHEWIDAVTPNNPVWVNRSDGHMMLANALAMKLAGITKDASIAPCRPHHSPAGSLFAIMTETPLASSRTPPKISSSESSRPRPMRRWMQPCWPHSSTRSTTA